MTTLSQGVYLANNTGVEIKELDGGFQECLSLVLLQQEVMYTPLQQVLPS